MLMLLGLDREVSRKELRAKTGGGTRRAVSEVSRKELRDVNTHIHTYTQQPPEVSRKELRDGSVLYVFNITGPAKYPGRN